MGINFVRMLNALVQFTSGHVKLVTWLICQNIQRREEIIELEKRRESRITVAANWLNIKSQQLRGQRHRKGNPHAYVMINKY